MVIPTPRTAEGCESLGSSIHVLYSGFLEVEAVCDFNGVSLSASLDVWFLPFLSAPSLSPLALLFHVFIYLWVGLVHIWRTEDM